MKGDREMATKNLTLFRKVRNRILRIPEAYDQEVFGVRSRKAPCGARACLAGNALIEAGFCTPQELIRNEAGHSDERFCVFDEAAKLLGVTQREAFTLFSKWPEPFGSRWREAKTKEQQARVAADYLNRIIATGKVTD
jgi:hypothetical protein